MTKTTAADVMIDRSNGSSPSRSSCSRTTPWDTDRSKIMGTILKDRVRELI
jgi:hypothetical protein